MKAMKLVKEWTTGSQIENPAYEVSATSFERTRPTKRKTGKSPYLITTYKLNVTNDKFNTESLTLVAV
jgi:hypothetical protein